MYQECASWEKYRERLFAKAKAFEQLKSTFQEEKAASDKEKTSEEWGLQGLRTSSKPNENKKLFAARAKITNLEADVALLKKSEATLKEKYEEANSPRECVEVDLNARILSKDKDLAEKDAEIIELKRRLLEAQEKNESLEIDLAAWKVKADTAEEARKVAEEARKISISALIVANSILNATELDQVVAGLTDAMHVVGHRAGYMECAQHVETALKQHFGTRHCSVNEKAEERLIKAEEVYDNLSLPIMDLVTDALKLDDYVARLKSIFVVPETVELSDEEEIAEGDGA
ncbi:hypothetical protein Hanom_Chr06g00519991 [Helianthus anomalus]